MNRKAISCVKFPKFSIAPDCGGHYFRTFAGELPIMNLRIIIEKGFWDN